MEFSTHFLTNGKMKGRLKFDSGKIVKLNPDERWELIRKIEEWGDIAIQKQELNKLFKNKN